MKQLSAKFVREVTEPGRYYDGDAGLFLLVADGVREMRKSYVQRVTVAGRRVDIGLGSARWKTLTDARAAAQANRKIARMGGDPRSKRSTVPTFAEALESVIAIQRDVWRNGAKSEAQWRASLRDYAGALMPKAVDAIGPGDVLAVLSPIWTPKRETARRVRQRIAAVMKHSIAEGHRESNPVDAIGSALPKNGVRKAHHKALPHGEVGAALATVRESGAWWATKAAFELTVLTAARSGEVRGARWEEVDVAAAVWTVPGARMKAGRDHRVPLSGRALEILADAREHGDGSGLVFPSPRGKALSDATLGKLLKDHGIEAVPHGFRSSFRDWCGEAGVAREVAEMALAHAIRDKAEAAYARSDLLDRRRDLMTEWSRYIHPDTA